MDDLEKLIMNNKSAFEELPINREALWQKIELDLEEQVKVEPKRISIWRPLLKVAAMLFLISSIGLGSYFFGRQTQVASHQPVEFSEINAHYVHLINAKLQEVEENDVLSADEKKAFLNAIDDLQKEAENLQQEFRKNLDNEMVVSAIVQNYKQRLRLLEQLLNRIDKSKNKQNEKSILI